MPWQLLIGVSVVLYSFSTILQKILLRGEKTDPIAFSIYFQLLTGLMIGAFGFLTTSMDFPDMTSLLFNLVLMVVFYILGNILLFKSLQKIDASSFTIIFSSRGLFTVLASSILLREGLTLSQLGGAVLIFLSIMLVTLKSTKFSVTKWEILALLAAAFFGFASTNDRFLLGHFKLYPYVFIAFVLPALVTIPFYPKSLSKMKIFLQGSLMLKMILLCAIYAGSAVTFFIALQSQNSSQVAIANLTSVVVIVLFSIIFLKEKENLPKKILGALIGFAGMVLLG